MAGWALACAGLGPAGAQALPAAPDAGPDLRRWADSPAWRQLLHWDETAGRSRIRSPGFFASPQGDQDPLAELQATLQLLDGPVPPGAGAPAACRWPARRLWLMEQGLLPSASSPLPAGCAALAAWARWDELTGVSLILVSGYLGNPASTFGHALLRLDTRSGARVGGRTDVSVNFGALIPPGEGALPYVVKGLSGGYVATFSDKPFYANDLVYAHTEFRDMWVYRLALDEGQRARLVLHLWELLGQAYDYYFLTQNCGWRLAEVVAWATGRPVADAPTAWYAPVELFHALHREDRPEAPTLAEPPQYKPSADRVLQAHFDRLAPEAQAAARRLMAAGPQALGDALGPALHPLPLAQQQALLETLLAWAEVRLAAQSPDVQSESRQLKDRLLLARLRLPARAQPPLEMTPLPSPALGHAPTLIGLGLGRSRGAAGWHAQGELAAFSYERAGRHGLPQGELVAGHLRWRSRDRQDAGGPVRVEAADLFQVLKLGRYSALDGPLSRLSWHLRAGVDRRTVPVASGRAPAPLRLALEGGLGAASAPWSGLDIWLMGQARWREGETPRVGPWLGATWRQGGVGAWADWQHLRGGDGTVWRGQRLGLVADAAPGQTWRVSLDREGASPASLQVGVQFFR
ncbi:Lnb N-terminal periplasmic domain-containing protein [Ideonella livida]|uniref:DUF4105 domain-containing protein n=1 Tax=Ideonella livida TaxID=2707176 RepID=A0A7C9TJ92_9BURK|nr:DUF4105 domain-containing protein [Ideonella livida]NDY91919.1 DUF4105 domain-containing protein [Ideonella livida]